MKKLLLAAVASAFVAGPAFAQGVTVGPDTSINIPLSGTVAKKCSISAYLDGPFNALNMGITTSQGAESVSVNCNYGGSASVTFSSANNGVMKNGTDTVGYKVYVSGSANPFSSGVALTSPIVWNGWPASTNSNQTRSLSVALDAPATVAGTYTDTITLAVAAN